MQKILIASMDQGAGKTSIIAGWAKALNQKLGYMKPLGDRLIYHKKRLWDYDSAVMAGVFELAESPEDMTIGFEHTKLRYMYDDTQRQKKLLEMAATMGQDKDILFVEGGRDLRYGESLSLDPLAIAKYIGAKLFIIVTGSTTGHSGDDSVVDDVVFIKNHIELKGVDFGGVIINKVRHIEDFKETALPTINETGIKVVGLIPFRAELTYLNVNYLQHRLFAKVIAGENGLNKVIKNIFVGAASAEAALKDHLFQKEDKLIITSGDRSDMILAALDTNTSAVLLTNNIVPPAHLIAKANERNIPLLLVANDTYQTATTQIDDMEPLLVKEDTAKLVMLAQLVKEHLTVKM